MTTRDYAAQFEVRGASYDRAMRRFPGVREAEFAQLIARAALRPGMVVADVPAGGGYMQARLPGGVTCWAHEPCAGFAAEAASPGPLLPLPWPEASVDVAMSLAGVHHLADKRPFWAELRRVVRPGGRLVLSDVAATSPVAAFLDGFVDAHTPTGHVGAYLDATTGTELVDCGWQVRQAERVAFCWRAAARATLAAFCVDLFGLEGVDVAEVEDVLATALGFEALPGGGVGLRWELLTIVAERPHG